MIFSILFLFLCTFSSAQMTQAKGEYYKWFDDFSGQENTNLYNGIGYVEKYRVINEYHKFFLSSDFLNGSITYRGQQYFGLKMKYDLDEDLVILSLTNGSGIVFLQPAKRWIDDFTIEGHKFIKIGDERSKGLSSPGFYELLLTTPSVTLLKKYEKKKYTRTKRKVVYYEFKGQTEKILLYNDSYYKVDSRGDLLKIFPEFRSEIKSYSKKAFRGSADNSAMIAVLKRINVLLLTQRAQQ